MKNTSKFLSILLASLLLSLTMAFGAFAADETLVTTKEEITADTLEEITTTPKLEEENLNSSISAEEGEPVSGDFVSVSVVTPKNMSIRFITGQILTTGDSFYIEIGQEITFQMCTNNFETDIFDNRQSGISGTVVYNFRVSDRYDERSYDEKSKTFVIPKGDLVLRTDVNNCFMAYKYHFTSGDFNKQTGIPNVTNTPVESLSVNLPLGASVKSEAFIDKSFVGIETVFVENSVDLTESYTDYYWNY